MKRSLVLLLPLLLGSCSVYPYENVALHGKATQSHRLAHNFGDANSAIDGNRDSNYFAGSCAHTIEMTNPWWRVDLLHRYVITSVIITNRADCCSEKINGAEVHIGDSLRDNGIANPLAGVISQISAGSSITLTMDKDVVGRYVTIVVPGPNRYLMLCEVEVYGYLAPTGVNLALKGKASQSSIHQEGMAYLAIDGNNDNEWAHGSCSHTKDDFAPWWRLDLITAHKVFTVKITNRINSQVAPRLNGAEIRIGDSLDNNGNNNPRCAVIENIPAGATAEFKCNGMDGRFVNIVIPGRTEYLSLCEVEVYGSVLDLDHPAMCYTSKDSRKMKHSSVLLLALLLGSCSVYAYHNVALHGKATQSHRYGHYFGDANSAIDGNRNSDFSAGSCAHTIEMTNPWWRVDLLHRYVITSVVITNRADCCPEKIIGAEVHIGDSLEDNGIANPLAAVISEVSFRSSVSLKVENDMVGRYVTIVLPGPDKTLTLCEVEVYGYLAPTGVNLALKGKASQSTLFLEGMASLANDGNNDSNRDHRSCAHTKNEFAPWWRLDLITTHKVFTVKVTNRREYSSRLNGAEIRIGDSLDNNGNNNPRCAVIENIPAGATDEFKCNGMDGRFVNIVIPGRAEFLTLCEVEVYGSVLDQEKMKHSSVLLLALLLGSCLVYAYENVALRGKATHSSQLKYPLASAINAIDGNRDSNYYSGSCTHTLLETNPWWRVDLLESYIVTSIIITNRGDCCPERLNGAQIHVGNSPRDHGIANPLCAVISSIPGGVTETFSCNGMDGRFINIIVPGRRTYLVLCEVEVYGSRLD
ncbi:uncharacterized protein LOC141801242 [Halichoeres trimaculatus]|uniref:uncharacterized protein LOC141801242 n=1 Tax=Halichoeres trimaculatus TaxID=147232 RepID=UPI003D9E3028